MNNTLQSSNFIKFEYEVVGGISAQLVEKTKAEFEKAGVFLEKEWNVSAPIKVKVFIQSDEEFREGKTEGPQSWKYCLLLRDYDAVYCNVNVFNVLPDEAFTLIKHETAHIIIAQLVNDKTAYRRSFLLIEGTAGIDNATVKLIEKIKEEDVKNIPNPLDVKTMEDIKNLGGDTNKDPFTKQLGYLIIFSFVEFLRVRYGEVKIIELYKSLVDDKSFQGVYAEVCKDDIEETVEEWRNTIIKV